MKDKNTLNEILYVLLIELDIESSSLIEARNLLLQRYDSLYSSDYLYKKIHSGLRRLKALNLIDMTTVQDPGPVTFKIKAQFHYQNFALIKSTKNLKKKGKRTIQTSETTKIKNDSSSKDPLIAIVRERIREADSNASKLRELEKKLTADADLEDQFNAIIDLWLNSRCCKS